MSRADFTDHPMPNGSVCYYRDSDHSYWKGIEPRKKREPDGEWKGCGQLTGVSTVASPFDFRPDALMRWAAKTNGIGIAQLVNIALENGEAGFADDQLRWLCDPATIWRTLERESLTFDDVRDQAAERGTNVHKHALNELAIGNPVPAYAELTEDEQGYSQGVAAFWLDHDPEPLQAEAVVLAASLGVAGRLDVRGRLKARCGHATCPCADLDLATIGVIDAKTSGFIPTKHHVQIAGYDFCAQESGYGPAAWGFILQVDEHGGYKLIPVQADGEDFKDAVRVYRKAAKINNAANKDRKAREE